MGMAERPFCVTTSWVRQGDIDILMMGEVPVGRIKDKAWIFNLAGHVAFWRGERTEQAARAALGIAFSDWLRRAGIEKQGELFA